MAIERERVREREKEPLRYLSKEDPYCFLSREEEKKYLRSLPRVIRTSEVTPMVIPVGGYTQTEIEDTKEGRSGLLVYLDWYYNKWNELKYPIYTMTCMAGRRGRQRVRRWGGGHRHFMEAVFYMVGGKGHETQDGIRYEWEGEGILCVPTYVYHNHFTDQMGPGEAEVGFAVISRIFEYLGIADLEQLDINPVWIERFGGVPPWLGVHNPWMEGVMKARQKVTRWDRPEPRGIYERYMKMLVEENEWRMRTSRFVKADDCPWEDSPQGRLRFLIHPWSPACIKTLNVFIQEIPAGSRSGKHRHVAEEIIVVQEGKGHDIHDGVRYDWHKGDVVCIPLMTEHQHFNDDPRNKAKFVSVSTRWYELVGHGGMEQIEPCPEWKG